MKKYLIYQLIWCFVFGAISLEAQNSWESKAAFGGTKRSRGIGFSIGNRGYIGTGEDTANNVLNDLWEYDPGSDLWVQKASLPGVGRRDATAFVIGNKGYVGFGIDAAESFLGTEMDDFYEYDPVTNTWAIKADIPVPGAGVYFCTGFAIGSKGYACGGKLGNSNYSDQLWEYNPQNDTWTLKANYLGGERYSMCAFVLNGKAYVGTGTDEDILRQDFYMYDPVLNSWTVRASLPGSGRFGCTGFAIGQKGYAALGTDGGYKDEIWEYDPINNSWMIKAPFDGGARRSAAGFVINGAAYIGTGKGASGSRRDFWQYQQYIIGVDEYANAETFAVFPNPATDEISLAIPDVADQSALQVVVYAIDGREVLRTAVSTQTRVRIDTHALAAGMYVCVLRNETGLQKQTQFIVR